MVLQNFFQLKYYFPAIEKEALTNFYANYSTFFEGYQ